MTWRHETEDCGNVNPDDAANCLVCGADRPAPKPAGMSEEERAALAMVNAYQREVCEDEWTQDDWQDDEFGRALRAVLAQYRAALAPLEAEVKTLRKRVRELEIESMGLIKKLLSKEGMIMACGHRISSLEAQLAQAQKPAVPPLSPAMQEWRRIVEDSAKPAAPSVLSLGSKIRRKHYDWDLEMDSWEEAEVTCITREDFRSKNKFGGDELLRWEDEGKKWLRLPPAQTSQEQAPNPDCDTCGGTGEIDETVGGGVRACHDTHAPCPDCVKPVDKTKPAASPPGEVRVSIDNVKAAVNNQLYLLTCVSRLRPAIEADIRAAVERERARNQAITDMWQLDVDAETAKDKSKIAELEEEVKVRIGAHREREEEKNKLRAELGIDNEEAILDFTRRMKKERDAALAEVERLKGELEQLKNRRWMIGFDYGDNASQAAYLEMFQTSDGVRVITKSVSGADAEAEIAKWEASRKTERQAKRVPQVGDSVWAETPGRCGDGVMLTKVASVSGRKFTVDRYGMEKNIADEGETWWWECPVGKANAGKAKP